MELSCRRKREKRTHPSCRLHSGIHSTTNSTIVVLRQCEIRSSSSQRWAQILSQATVLSVCFIKHIKAFNFRHNYVNIYTTVYSIQ